MNRLLISSIGLLFVISSSVYAVSELKTDTLFNGYTASGAIVELTSGDTLVLNASGCSIPHLPCSTFKIPNSIFALEAGAIADPEEIIKWNGVSDNITSWNHDHCLRTAIQNSVVWFYQELARRIGKTRMQAYLDTIHYGNRDISAGIDRFWLSKGSILISDWQQIEFLTELTRNQLPFSKRSTDIVKAITIQDSTNSYILHGKTGSQMIDGKSVMGRYVGWIEQDTKIYVFAFTIRAPDHAYGQKAKEIAWELFRMIGITSNKRN